MIRIMSIGRVRIYTMINLLCWFGIYFYVNCEDFKELIVI